MITTLENINDEIKTHISNCLSTSNICGKILRESHYFLGKQVGELIDQKRFLKNKKVAVLIMMRAGLPFGMGITDILEENNKIEVLFSNSINNKDFSYDVIIIADAVINTGKTILDEISKLDKTKVIIAANVVSDKFVDNLNELDVFATRISNHSYVGSNVKKVEKGKGPDTGERLFNSSFFD